MSNLYIRIFTYICIYIYAYIHIHIHIYICTYIYIYIHTHVRQVMYMRRVAHMARMCVFVSVCACLCECVCMCAYKCMSCVCVCVSPILCLNRHGLPTCKESRFRVGRRGLILSEKRELQRLRGSFAFFRICLQQRMARLQGRRTKKEGGTQGNSREKGSKKSVTSN